ncbi:MAG: alpha-hydroxy-acid oxidizing protein [Treponemataceae bacterium]|nr:alpha-hydroxy-acid oxidizing protein [Treponemataceae bacterium]
MQDSRLFSKKCHICPICNGLGCLNELPGMGGFGDNINFQNNCQDWNRVAHKHGLEISDLDDYNQGLLNYDNLSEFPIRIGPMTGGVENVGYNDEKQFYYDILNFAVSKGLKLSIGDGCPDFKLQYGIEVVQNLIMTNSDNKAAVFIKPYPNDRILERIKWAQPVASHIGIDIDSYNILTMRNQVQLEKKSDSQLVILKKACNVPFVIKGVFTDTDIELVKKVKPDIVYISNHGGRVENRIGSTAEFLDSHAKTLKNYCDQLWVDGGIRTIKDIKTALHLGADQVAIGRPVITALLSSLE